MHEKILALDAELSVRKRTIIFLISEYVSRNQTDREKILAFLADIIPDMEPQAAEIARELVNELKEGAGEK